MLDENLPAFFLKPSGNGVKHQREIYHSHHGSDPEPSYTLHNLDPASPSPAHKNCYGAALFDAYNPEVLFGEVLARPGWTQPTLSAEEIKRNNGIPPPPQPILPTEFAIQLYNPDQQVRIETKEGKWGASDSYEFSLPQTSFRTPSASNLDRGQSDPASLAYTPKLQFVWRKESKLSKDLTCYMVGKSTDTLEKKKRSARKDPDIAIALWRNMRELTVYEPNVHRLELEDPKGLEVVLILGAVVMKDLFFASKEHIKELFNISDVPGERKLSGGGRKLSNPSQIVAGVGLGHPPPSTATHLDIQRNNLPKLQTTPPPPAIPSRPPPPHADPRSQWQLDAETARLRAQAEAEAREEKRRRREREKADELEAKRLQRMADEEAKIRRQKQEAIDRETERLRKEYGVPSPPAAPNTSSARHAKGRSSGLASIPQGATLGSNGLYTQPSSSASAVMMSGANPGVGSSLGVQKPAKKKSFFGLRSLSDEGDGSGGKKLNKKGSTMCEAFAKVFTSSDHGSGSVISLRYTNIAMLPFKVPWEEIDESDQQSYDAPALVHPLDNDEADMEMPGFSLLGALNTFILYMSLSGQAEIVNWYQIAIEKTLPPTITPKSPRIEKLGRLAAFLISTLTAVIGGGLIGGIDPEWRTFGNIDQNRDRYGWISPLWILGSLGATMVVNAMGWRCRQPSWLAVGLMRAMGGDVLAPRDRSRMTATW